MIMSYITHEGISFILIVFRQDSAKRDKQIGRMRVRTIRYSLHMTPNS